MNHEAPGCELLMVRQAGAQKSHSFGLRGPIDMLDALGANGLLLQKRFSKEGFSQLSNEKRAPSYFRDFGVYRGKNPIQLLHGDYFIKPMGISRNPGHE